MIASLNHRASDLPQVTPCPPYPGIDERRHLTSRSERLAATVISRVLLNDVGSRPGPIEEVNLVVGDAGSGRVHSRYPALVGGAVGEDQFGDDVEVVRAGGG